MFPRPYRATAVEPCNAIHKNTSQDKKRFMTCFSHIPRPILVSGSVQQYSTTNLLYKNRVDSDLTNTGTPKDRFPKVVD
jgi:hypothetical protein